MIKMSYDEYEKTLFGRTTSNQNVLAESKISWYIPSFSSIISVVGMIVIVILVVAFKYNKLASLLSILGLVKKSDALLLDTSSTLGVTFECFSIFLCICTAVYCCIKYFAIVTRMYRNMTSPCCESLSLYKPPACNVLLYIANASHYAYLHVGELLAAPHDIHVLNAYSPLEITFHRAFWGSFITISKHELILKTSEHSFALPTAVAVPVYLRNTVDQIVHNPPMTISIAAGQDGIYRSFPLVARPQPRAPIAAPSRAQTLGRAHTLSASTMTVDLETSRL